MRESARLTDAEIARLVESIADLPAVVASAEPAAKAGVYQGLCLTLRYQPEGRTVTVEARPMSGMYVKMCPRGDLNSRRGGTSPNRGSITSPK